MRVKDAGKSEDSPVMGGIGVALLGNATRQHYPTRKRADFPLVFPHERVWLTSKEAKQMTVALAADADASADASANASAGAGASAAGAASHDTVDWQAIEWHTIDWPSVHENVRRLQARIVKATQDGRWGKVKALQRLLTHSFSAKALAVKRVTENHGKRTPGIDGKTWSTPEQKSQALQHLGWRGYRPQPLRRLYIPKSNGKKRPLSIATMQDRAMQAVYLLALDPIAETTADPNSYGFRRERCTADAIEQCFTILARANSPQWILDADIASCYDRISHEWLLAQAHIPMDKDLLRKWLRAGYLERHVFYPTKEGVPQGSIIGPVLANLTLDGLETRLREHFAQRTPSGISGAPKVHLIRYADDVVITGATQELLATQVKPVVETFLRARGLELSSEKTRIVHIEEGFDFLGQHIRKYRNGRQCKLLIKPAHKNVHTFLTKVRSIVRDNKGATAGNLILQLNPVIRGWSQYHQHVVSKETYHKVDHAIYQLLWQWAKRRHPNKVRHWVRHKYFQTVEGRAWVFVGEVIGTAGKSQRVQLLHATDVPIKRHVKIRGAANPYDPEWEGYFEKRLDLEMASSLQGRRKLLYIWQQQKGICPVCQQIITKLTGWDNHHIVWRVYGGDDGAENRVLMHPNCHRQVHSQGLEVAKPRPERGERKA